MALSLCIRRSLSKLASSSLGRIRSISAVVNRESLRRSSSSPPFVSRGSLYSTAAIDRESSEKMILRVIDTEIRSAIDTDDRDLEEETAPGSFPFRIEDNPGHQTVTLTRDYKGEHIKVLVSMPSLDADENDHDDEEDGTSNESSIPLTVTVRKKSGLSLEFSCVAFPDEIAIDALSVNQTTVISSQDELANEGPDFEDLDENLKKTFYKFLEIRGVKASTTNFLHEYMMRKVKREYLLWLKNVKKFMEEE